MDITSLKNADIVQNNILRRETGIYGQPLIALSFTSNDSAITMFNNNITNLSSGFYNRGALKTDIFPFSWLFKFCDNNNYFSLDSAGPIIKDGTKMSLTAWKASTQKDSNAVSIDPYYINYDNLHILDTLLIGAGKPLGITTDIDGDIRPSTPTIGADEIVTGNFPQNIFVWPGDANSDMVADNNDLLPIGLKYGVTGQPRCSVSDVWHNFVSSNWNDTLPGGLNTKYTDCNGDGIVNMKDTAAINLNYGQIHTARIAYQVNASTTNNDIYLLFNKPFYLAGDTVVASVNIGDSSNPQSDFYGAAFSINYDPTYVILNSERFYFSNSWVGTINNNMIKMSRVVSANGTVNAALTRINHTDVAGYGGIAIFRFILKNTIPDANMNISVMQTTKTNAAGNYSTLNSGSDTILLVSSTTVGLPAVHSNSQMKFFPNPTSGKVYVSSNNEIGVLAVYNGMGQHIYEKNINSKEALLNTETWPPGIYLVVTHGRTYRLVVN